MSLIRSVARSRPAFRHRQSSASITGAGEAGVAFRYIHVGHHRRRLPVLLRPMNVDVDGAAAKGGSSVWRIVPFFSGLHWLSCCRFHWLPARRTISVLRHVSIPRRASAPSSRVRTAGRRDPYELSKTLIRLRSRRSAQYRTMVTQMPCRWHPAQRRPPGACR